MLRPKTSSVALKSRKTMLCTIARFGELVLFVLPLTVLHADATSPKFTSCAGNIGKQYTTSTCHSVTWDEPTAEDDDQSIPVSRVSGEGPGSTFSEGSHDVQYRATDSEGNYASCTIRFEVVVIRCPSLSAPYDGHVACSDINNVGSNCTYMCFTGHQLHNGSLSRTCQLMGVNNSASWSGSPPACADSPIGPSVSPTPADTKSLTTAEIVGIVAACIAVLLIIVVVIAIVCKICRSKK